MKESEEEVDPAANEEGARVFEDGFMPELAGGSEEGDVIVSSGPLDDG